MKTKLTGYLLIYVEFRKLNAEMVDSLNSDKLVSYAGKENLEYNHAVGIIFHKTISRSFLSYEPINDRNIGLRLKTKQHMSF